MIIYNNHSSNNIKSNIHVGNSGSFNNKKSQKHNPSELLGNYKKTKKHSLKHSKYNYDSYLIKYNKKLLHKKDKQHKKDKHKLKQTDRIGKDEILDIKSRQYDKIDGGIIDSGVIDGGGVSNKYKLKETANKSPFATIKMYKSGLRSKEPIHLSIEKFNIATKAQYNQVKKNVRNTIIKLWFQSKLNMISTTQYEIVKILLTTYVLFARMKLENAKMLTAIELLYGNDTGIIHKLILIIDNILNYQRDINDIKLGTKNIKTPNKPHILTIPEIIKAQDKLRLELMTYTAFNSTKDIKDVCKATRAIETGNLKMVEQSHKNSKVLICAIGNYRKREAKFNKYYYLFKDNYKLFMQNFPNCPSDDIINLNLLDINIYETPPENINNFDMKKCDKEAQKTDLQEAINIAIENEKARLPKSIQDKAAKMQKINVEFLARFANFKEIVDDFNKGLMIMQNIFKKGESYGIHHYYGIPAKISWFNKKLSSSRLIIKPEQLKKLEVEPKFIKDFTDMIEKFKKDNKATILHSRSIMNVIIPNIVLYENINFNTQTIASKINVKPAIKTRTDPIYFTNNKVLYINKPNKSVEKYSGITQEGILYNKGIIVNGFYNTATKQTIDYYNYNSNTDSASSNTEDSNNNKNPLDNSYISAILDEQIFYYKDGKAYTGKAYTDNIPNTILNTNIDVSTYTNHLFSFIDGKLIIEQKHSGGSANKFLLPSQPSKTAKLASLSTFTEFDDELINNKYPNTKCNKDLNPIHNLKTNFRVFSINLYESIKDKLLKNLQIKTFFPCNYPYELPIIICVQNGDSEMINNNSEFCRTMLDYKYISVAYSIHSKTNYNIIFVRKDCINLKCNTHLSKYESNKIENNTETNVESNINDVNDIIAINQTDYFTLNDLPESMNIATHQQSFATATFSFNSNTSIYFDKSSIKYNPNVVGFDLNKTEIKTFTKYNTSVEKGEMAAAQNEKFTIELLYRDAIDELIQHDYNLLNFAKNQKEKSVRALDKLKTNYYTEYFALIPPKQKSNSKNRIDDYINNLVTKLHRLTPNVNKEDINIHLRNTIKERKINYLSTEVESASSSRVLKRANSISDEELQPNITEILTDVFFQIYKLSSKISNQHTIETPTETPIQTKIFDGLDMNNYIKKFYDDNKVNNNDYKTLYLEFVNKFNLQKLLTLTNSKAIFLKNKENFLMNLINNPLDTTFFVIIKNIIFDENKLKQININNNSNIKPISDFNNSIITDAEIQEIDIVSNIELFKYYLYYLIDLIYYIYEYLKYIYSCIDNSIYKLSNSMKEYIDNARKQIRRMTKYSVDEVFTDKNFKNIRASFAHITYYIIDTNMSIQPYINTSGGSIECIDKECFSVLTTALVGSNPDDIYYIDDINKFSKDIDGNKIDGLRDVQINMILKIFTQHTNSTPDIFCGDFGGIIKNILKDNYITNTDILEQKTDKVLLNLATEEQITINKYLTEHYNLKYKKITNNQITIDDITKYYENGMNTIENIFTTKIPTSTSTYVKPNSFTSDLPYTKETNHTISNYIFYKSNSSNKYGMIDILKTNKQLFNKCGKILPISIDINIVNKLSILTLNKITPNTDVNNKVTLYSSDEIKNIVNLLDLLLSNFAFGYKAYVKRDLGCFSLNDDTIINSPFSMRKFPKLLYDKKLIGPNILQNSQPSKEVLQSFYTMNYPSFIESYLFNQSKTLNIGINNNFYSENQLSTSQNINYIPNHLTNVFGNLEHITNTDIEILLRMLLIPTDNLFVITDNMIDSKLLDMTDYKLLANIFTDKFYKNIVKNSLDKRINELLSHTPNKYLFDDILSRETIIDESGNSKIRLTKINDPNLILNLYEYIFIMLKKRFIDYHLYNMYNKQTLERDKLEIPEEHARISNKISDYALTIYNMMINIITSSDNNGLDKDLDLDLISFDKNAKTFIHFKKINGTYNYKFDEFIHEFITTITNLIDTTIKKQILTRTNNNNKNKRDQIANIANIVTELLQSNYINTDTDKYTTDTNINTNIKLTKQHLLSYIDELNANDITKLTHENNQIYTEIKKYYDLLLKNNNFLTNLEPQQTSNGIIGLNHMLTYVSIILIEGILFFEYIKGYHQSLNNNNKKLYDKKLLLLTTPSIYTKLVLLSETIYNTIKPYDDKSIQNIAIEINNKIQNIIEKINSLLQYFSKILKTPIYVPGNTEVTMKKILTENLFKNLKPLIIKIASNKLTGGFIKLTKIKSKNINIKKSKKHIIL